MQTRSMLYPLLLAAIIFCGTSVFLPFFLRAQTGPDLALDTSFYVIPENAVAPTELFSPQYFSVNVDNVGDEVANEVIVSCRITDMTFGDEIFYVEKNFGVLLPGARIENELLNEEAFEMPFTDIFEEHDYRGEYEVRTASSDSNPLNNAITFNFTTSYQSIAKEAGRTAGVQLAGRQNYVGNCFYLPEGQTFKVRDLEFMVDNADELVAGEGGVSIFLYETLGDQNQDGLIDSLEYNQIPIVFNEYIFTGMENQTLIRFPISIDDELIILQGGRYYLLVLVYIGEDEEDNLVLSVGEDYNYTATSSISAQYGVPQYANISYSSSDLFSDRPLFTLNGLGSNRSPVIRFVSNTIIYGTQEAQLPSAYQMALYPNPVRDDFVLAFDFPEPLTGNIAVFNSNGRLVKSYAPRELYQNTFSEKCQDWPSGIYTVQVVTEKGVTSKSLVIQH